jgi:hypothetical protein
MTPSPSRPRRTALARIELLVVRAICTAVIIGPLMAAVQMAREGVSRLALAYPGPLLKAAGERFLPCGSCGITQR